MLLTVNELDKLMNSIGLDQFKRSVKENNETRARKQLDIFNHWFERFNEVNDYNQLSPWVDDVLTGAARLSTGHTKTSAMMIFHLLKTMPYYTTSEIMHHINRKRGVLGGDVIDADSYCRWLRSALVSAMRSLDYYTEKGAKFLRSDGDDTVFISFGADAKAWDAEKDKLDSLNRYPQTIGELTDKLRQSGLSPEQIGNYLRSYNHA